jgi:hypothetical protein
MGKPLSEPNGVPAESAAMPPGAACPGSTIFLSIAAYRDPELIPTIENALANARWPERLRFGICWQHGLEETRPKLFDDPRFRILDVDWQKSRGACWARAQVMELWDGEDWYLQLDSHHRFVADWDAKLLDQAKATGSPKPLLTGYAASYDPAEPDLLDPEALRMEFDCFTEDGLIIFRPGHIPDGAASGAPVRSRFVSGHFLFAPATFVTEVPYDPDLYFIGEEITLSVRAYTHGYDLYHPGVPILWHEYTRRLRTKHWDDHTDSEQVEMTWGERDKPSRNRARQLLIDPDFGIYGLGRQRSLADYEAYTGINFEHRRAQDYTRQHHEPPNPPIEADWPLKTNDHTVWITVPTAAMPPAATTTCWYVGVFDDAGVEIFRADAVPAEIEGLLGVAGEGVTIVRQFESMAAPARWSIRPHTETEGWLDAIEGDLVASGASHHHCLWSGGDATGSTGGAHSDGAEDDSSVRFPTLLPGVQWSQVEDGFDVVHPGQSSSITINHSGVFILELANGRYSISDIIDVVRSAYGLTEPPRDMVFQFLAQAESNGLVQIMTSHEREQSERRIRA